MALAGQVELSGAYEDSIMASTTTIAIMMSCRRSLIKKKKSMKAPVELQVPPHLAGALLLKQFELSKYTDKGHWAKRTKQCLTIKFGIAGATLNATLQIELKRLHQSSK